jgi:hypothetical protein
MFRDFSAADLPSTDAMTVQDKSQAQSGLGHFAVFVCVPHWSVVLEKLV